jgi:FtsP/CotA-like multicopper oxidase with cupredoxin domain
MPAVPPRPAVCGVPVASGALRALPQIDVASLSRDDRGLPELILHVARDGDRFCYAYTVNGVAHHDAPVLRMHRGDRFAIRIVNDLAGAAKGGSIAASAVPACRPMAMPMQTMRPLPGYLGHSQFYGADSAMNATDVNLHLHGFQGPAAQENVFLSTLSNAAHACEYDITIPRTQPIGTYFYHPHAHGMSDDEVAGGLSGMWIVEPDKPQIAPQNQHEIVLQYRVPFTSDNDNALPPLVLFQRAALAHQMALKDPAPVHYDPFNPPPWPSSWPVRAAGQTMPKCGVIADAWIAVNGADAPATLSVPAGEPQLLRILNATADSFQYVELRDAAGNARPLRIVGRDGVPFSADARYPLAKYVSVDGVDLVPTNRADVLLTLKRGESLTLASRPTCFSVFDENQVPRDLLRITAGPAAASPAQIDSAPLTARDSAAVQLLQYARAHRANVRRRAITYTEYVVPNSPKKGGHGEFYITETSKSDFHERPFTAVYAKGAMVPQPDIVVKRGSIEEWYLFNATLEPHTIHIHQMAFVAEDEKPQPVMLDTVLVRTGEVLPNKADPDYPLIKPGLTKILLDFRNVPRGTFLFHCHMLFHEDRGMMGIIKVE